MNYEKIYNDLMMYCKSTNIIDRIKSRDINDIRLQINIKDIYVEKHHIIPSHDNGPDDESNLVVLLPEEHYLAHFIRYKAFNQTNDFISVRCTLNGYAGKKNKKIKQQLESFSINKRIALFKQHITSFRKMHGWQTDDGKLRISEARKGTFPCVDAITGISVGSHKKDHPKIISGEWVHHSKGKVSVTEISSGKRMYVRVEDIKNNRHLYKTNCADGSGSKNQNYKEMTPERKERVYALIPKSIIDNIHFSSSKFEELLKEEFKNDFKKISHKWIENNFGSFQNLLNEYNMINGTTYKKIYRYVSIETRAHLSNINKGKKRND